MAIIRQKRQSHFTVINNQVFQREHLSFEAMGLLGYLLSKPDNWQVSPAELANVTQGTRKHSRSNAIYAVLNELVTVGYVSRNRKSTGHVDYLVFDEPHHENPNEENPKEDKPHQENPHQDYPTQVNNKTSTRTEEKKVSTEINASADACVSAPAKAKRQNRKADAIALLVANGVSEQIANDFMAVRTGKRAGTLTETAMNGIATQAAKAGLTVEQAVTVCIDRNWVGFNADWIKPTHTRVNKTDSSWLLLKSRKEAVVAWDEAKREALVTRRNHESADWKEPQWMPVPDVNLLNQIRQHFVEAA